MKVRLYSDITLNQWLLLPSFGFVANGIWCNAKAFSIAFVWLCFNLSIVFFKPLDYTGTDPVEITEIIT